MTKEEARQEIAKLVAKYQSLDERAIREYNEANTRRNFIEPLFSALGWDIRNREEVTEEESISRKRVDYAFRLRGIPKFFLEAKALKADLDNPEYAKQAINYAYHKGTTWAVLTDFEGLKVFNAEWKEPIVTRSLFFKLNYDEYLSRFDCLWLLSRPACEQNLLDQKALDLFKKTKKTPVGQQLFSDLVSWRGLLDKYLSAYNKKCPSYLIDEAVQRILDRLIFIRTCEDREIEPPILRPLLRQWQNGAQKNLLGELRHIWRDFDEGYDSRLFLPHLADELECEPTPFVEVINGLYTTKDGSIEYDFNAIDADVLGGVYEQYLEHLIKRAGKEIEVIPARGKRKAQGIYYTPKFVVHYIAENTLGPALKDKPLNEARKIRILDPACGSGSFLVEALDYLEQHWKRQKWLPQSSPDADVKQKDFFDYVTKIQFLTQNLYGVDLDAQAVEIAQLNLLLKAVNQGQRLPDLVNNIRQGNSLISGTEDELKGYFGDSWRERKPFNWEREFEDIMANGGFDVVIGNPPYMLLQPQNVSEDELRFIHAHYLSAQYKVDTFHLFLERGISLLAEDGKLGFIVPNTFLMNIYTSNLRKLVLDTCKILEIVIIPRQVFPEAEVDNAILVLQKEPDPAKRSENEIKCKIAAENAQLSAIFTSLQTEGTVSQRAFLTQPNYLFNISLGDTLDTIFTKVDKSSWTLGELARVHFGLQTRDRRHYPDDVVVTTDRTRIAAPYQPCLTGKDIQRYAICFSNRYVYFDESIRAGGCWDKEMHLSNRKIIIRQIGEYPIAAFDDEGYCCLNTAFMVKSRVPHLDLRYALGIINSRFIRAYWRGRFFDQKVLFPKIKGTHLKQLPIHRIDFDAPAEKKLHDDLVALVDRMLELNKHLAPIRNTPCNEQDELLRQIERTDKEIDNLIYDLYGLTKEERKIVEGKEGFKKQSGHSGEQVK